MFTFIYGLRFWYCDLIFIFALEWTANFSPSIFPSFSDSSSRKTLEFIYTGWRRWGAGKGLFSLLKKSGISQLFMVICFPHLLALNLAFEKSRIILHLIDTSFSLAFFQFMFLSSFWKCWLGICLLSQSYDFSVSYEWIC